MLLGDYLQKNGYRASTVDDGAAMRRVLARECVDLLVLDVMLRGEDGLSCCRAVRQESETAIIMLTARGDPLDRIIGLEMGADDYLAKPFLPRELLVRIRTVLRRVNYQGGGRPHAVEIQRFRFGGWCLETVSRSLMDSNGVVVALSGSEYRLLVKLLSAGRRVLTRQQLADPQHAGRGFDVNDRSIDLCVSRLRQLLRDDAREPTIIKTVYGEGYVLGVDVEMT